jgi:hypothetical protein
MQRFLILLPLTAIVLLSGCFSEALSDADRSKIKSVTLNSKIETTCEIEAQQAVKELLDGLEKP